MRDESVAFSHQTLLRVQPTSLSSLRNSTGLLLLTRPTRLLLFTSTTRVYPHKFLTSPHLNFSRAFQKFRAPYYLRLTLYSSLSTTHLGTAKKHAYIQLNPTDLTRLAKSPLNRPEAHRYVQTTDDCILQRTFTSPLNIIHTHPRNRTRLATFLLLPEMKHADSSNHKVLLRVPSTSLHTRNSKPARDLLVARKRHTHIQAPTKNYHGCTQTINTKDAHEITIHRTIMATRANNPITSLLRNLHTSFPSFQSAIHFTLSTPYAKPTNNIHESTGNQPVTPKTPHETTPSNHHSTSIPPNNSSKGTREDATTPGIRKLYELLVSMISANKENSRVILSSS
ncbi:hypothetical protein BJ508DRAFT_307654 [Ascobolus immersus RN42]|uniref:Uncharacterized protein n=1 Tax=Ascobolus immersus RN42 TaxID=1160509 RepID=A0A3N4I2E7_ASCIM|nr:hypothetical protein BJ508DRAFT_307654 [Ascobolus immersus RN42]